MHVKNRAGAQGLISHIPLYACMPFHAWMLIDVQAQHEGLPAGTGFALA